MARVGVEYNLSVGRTLFGEAADLCALRYRDDFKPSQACRSGIGSLSMHGSQVALALPNAKASNAMVEFEGTLEHGKDGMDYVLVYDGHGFTLEALAGHVHDIRHIRRNDDAAPALKSSQNRTASEASPSIESNTKRMQSPIAEDVMPDHIEPLIDANCASQTGNRPNPESSPLQQSPNAHPSNAGSPCCASGTASSSNSSSCSNGSSSSSDSRSSTSVPDQDASREQRYEHHSNVLQEEDQAEHVVQLNDEEMQFLGISRTPDGQAEYI